jgi:hypothetical protein
MSIIKKNNIPAILIASIIFSFNLSIIVKLLCGQFAVKDYYRQHLWFLSYQAYAGDLRGIGDIYLVVEYF